MKKQLAFIALAAAFCAVPASAQTRNFEGFSLGVNAEFERSWVEATDGTSDSGTSNGVGLQVQYNWGLGSNFLLGVGLAANTGNRKAGVYTNGADAYTKDRYSFDLIPAIPVSDKVLVYIKASSIAATGMSSNGSTSASMQGLGYGLGVRALIDKSWFWQAGYDSIKFNDVTFSNGTVAKFKSDILTVGVGYRF